MTGQADQSKPIPQVQQLVRQHANSADVRAQSIRSLPTLCRSADPTIFGHSRPFVLKFWLENLKKACGTRGFRDIDLHRTLSGSRSSLMYWTETWSSPTWSRWAEQRLNQEHSLRRLRNLDLIYDKPRGFPCGKVEQRIGPQRYGRAWRDIRKTQSCSSGA